MKKKKLVEEFDEKELADEQREDQVGIFSQGLKPGTILKTKSGHRIKITDLSVFYNDGKADFKINYKFVTNRGKQGDGEKDAKAFYELLNEDVEMPEGTPINERMEVPSDEEIAKILDDEPIDEMRVDRLRQSQGQEESISEGCGDKDEEKDKVDNVKESEELQEALVKASKLEKDNLELQEKLSVCTAKATKIEEELSKYKACAARLSESAKEVKTLKGRLAEATETLNEKSKLIESSKKRLDDLISFKKDAKAQLEESANQIKESASTAKELGNQVESLAKQLDESKVTLTNYQKQLREAKSKYLDVKAQAIGIKKEEIINNLNESYTYKNIDSVCEELESKKKTLNKLPFKLTEDSSFSIKGKNEYISNNDSSNDDDDITDLLRSFF